MVRVLAFHGSPGWSNLLRKDMGDPNWDISYVSWKKLSLETIIDMIDQDTFLLGYSAGGEFIAQLTYHVSRIAGIVVYESPLRNGPPRAIGCPVLWLWNDYEPRTARRRHEKIKSYRWWRDRFNMTTAIPGLTGWKTSTPIYGHTKVVPYFPFIGHGWDISLNPHIERWMNQNA